MNNSWNGNINTFETNINLSTEMDYKAILKQHSRDILEDDNQSFLLISLAVVVGFVVLSACVCLVVHSRTPLKNMHCRRSRFAQIYIRGDRMKGNLDYVGAESNGCSEDWFDDDDDDPTECLLKGRLQIDNLYGNYQTAQASHNGLSTTPDVL